jgi:tryptophan 2,3-dioxygenase
VATETHEDYAEPILPGKGASDYERYLRTDELLALQKTAEERTHPDELLFQTVHQSSELWLKLATSEVERATAHVRDGDV